MAEFEANYAKESGVSVEILHEFGRYAQPCNCGHKLCEGWQMGHRLQDAIRADLGRMFEQEERRK